MVAIFISKNQDLEKAEDMLDRTIPFFNVIMRCDHVSSFAATLPVGYCFRMYRDGDENDWARLEYEMGDFGSIEEAKQYFCSTYFSNVSDIHERCVFAVNSEGKIVGSCIAWRDYRNGKLVASLHWLVVSAEFQGIGIGKALCQKTMNIFNGNGEFPIYIHTQPWSYKAIILYIRQGFKLQKTDTFSCYQNQCELALNVLKDKTDNSFVFSHNAFSCRAGVAARLKVLWFGLYVSCGEKDAAQHRGRPVRCAA